ncbi:MAG: hypothetical protein ACREFB_05025 [Stellaceae bacterium]
MICCAYLRDEDNIQIIPLEESARGLSMTPTVCQASISFPLKDLAFAQQLHESAHQCLPEIAGIIRKHGLENDVVIRLLHTHFPLEGGDALVHRWHDNAFETRPGRVPEGAVGCTFTPSRADPGRLDVIEYVAPGSDRSVILADRVLAIRDFVEEASAVLAQNGMSTLYGFGTRFYADQLDSDDDLILVECNDFTERRSETSAVDRCLLDGQSWTETSWRVVGDQLVVESACITSGAMVCERRPPPPLAM